MSVFEGEDLPVGIRTVRYLEYEWKQAERTEQEAAALAAYRLRLMSERETDGARLLSADSEGSLSDGVYRLRMRATYIENIAAVQEIQIEGIPTAAIPAGDGRIHGAGNCKDREYGADRAVVR